MCTSSLLLSLLLAPLVWGVFAPPMPAASSGDSLVYIGTYTRELSKGIYVYRFSAATGKLEPLGVAAEVANPSFLAIHPNRRFLYAVSEMAGAGGQKSGAVSAFSIDRSSGKLTLLNQASSRGAGPCHLTVDQTGKSLLVVNYGSGSTAALPVAADGRLAEARSFIQHSGSSVNPKRQQGPHAHSVNLSPDNRFAIVADLGMDQVLVYRLDAAKSVITPHDPPYVKMEPGAGPRHFSFHPDGRHAYVINELASTIAVMTWDAAKGSFSVMQTVPTLPKDFTGVSSTAEVRVHPNGKFVYGSNRGHDSIAVFAVQPGKGTLKFIEHTSTQGKTPRNFNLDPSGRFLIAANQSTDNLVVFRVDPKTGRLSPTGQVEKVGAPVCVRFLTLD